MKFSTRSEGAYQLIALSGEIDLHHSPQLREEILKTLKAKQNLLIELSAVEYIDSSGIASMIEGLQLANSSKLKFALVNASQAVMQVLQLARLDTIFPIYPSLEAALSQDS
ncbi:MAG: STAS domain-containing protein [Gammaproteobacteria bacterium]|nr:STAS domain-containing protein [Gammaproteobacteria bacterium]